jgi:demethylmenaquinone methyltransferase/2-methoxy-6-polyprenyl-1,4-benzoquinol methylase
MSKQDIKRDYPSLSTLEPDQHAGIVKDIFSSITKEYDFLNHLLSLRRDIVWRRTAVRRMNFFKTRRFLDVATGTADLAIEAALRFPDIRIVGLDLAQEMLNAGQVKIEKKHLTEQITLMQGDALQLPFPDDSFDVVAIAFGIRNIPDRIGALREMKRVIHPGGQIMVLEMSLPEKGSLLRPVYELLLKSVLPIVARPFSNNAQAYAYLADSISLFPPPSEFAEMMQNAGFKSIEQSRLSLGVTYLHIGYKPE